MTKTVKELDFIELEYTGRLTEDNTIFDTTIQKVAEENNIQAEHTQYGPVTICIGEGQLLKGLEDQLLGKEIGKESTITLTAEKAFGKKSAKLLKMIPARVFRNQNIQPVPGLQVSIDGQHGTIRRASAGRTMVDFNHPLAGRDVTYTVYIKRKITDKKEQISTLIKMAGIAENKFTVDIKEKNAKIVLKEKTHDNPKAQEVMLEQLQKTIKQLVLGLDNVEITTKEEKKKTAGDNNG